MKLYLTYWEDHEPTKMYWGVPVVLCRDCAKWHHMDEIDGVRYGDCDEFMRPDSCFKPATREDGFCAWGVTKEGDGE